MNLLQISAAPSVGPPMSALSEASEFTTTETIVICVTFLIALLIVYAIVDSVSSSVVSVITGKAFQRVRPPKSDPSLPDPWEVLSYGEQEIRRMDFEDLHLPAARFARFGRASLKIGGMILFFGGALLLLGHTWIVSFGSSLAVSGQEATQVMTLGVVCVGTLLVLLGLVFQGVFRRAPRIQVQEWHEADRRAKENQFLIRSEQLQNGVIADDDKADAQA